MKEFEGEINNYNGFLYTALRDFEMTFRWLLTTCESLSGAISLVGKFHEHKYPSTKHMFSYLFNFREKNVFPNTSS